MLQDNAKPLILPEACFECGLCVSNCPAKAIKQEAFSDQRLSGEGAEAKTFVFACERSAGLAADEAARLGFALGDNVRIEKVRCVGRVGLENMFAPLLHGARRVIVAGCHEGNCRSMESGTYAKMRIGHTAEDLGIGADKLSYHPVAANEPEKFRKITSDDE
jgi:heterodisulfide reductase subunit A